MKPWGEMTPRERDAALAEGVMGSVPRLSHPIELGHPCTYWSAPRGQWSVFATTPPPFTTDHDACRLVEDEIERRGLVREYITALGTVINAVPFDDDLWPWQHMRATPEQRCHAALIALGVW